MEKIKLHKEHRWLESLVGEWDFESEASMAPDQPPSKFEGTETVRSLGGAWVLCEGKGDMPEGGSWTTVMTLGYDPDKKKFVGTFIGSMMTHMWLYEGQLDATGKILTLDTEGPSLTQEEKMARYQDIIEIKSGDQRTLSSQTLGEDGKWHGFMTATYRRKR